MTSNSPPTSMSSSKRQQHKHTRWVRETGFGRWFLSTHTWYKYVLTKAVVDFTKMLGERLPPQARLLDAGCGQGLAFGLLETYFAPQQIVGVDIDQPQLTKASLWGQQFATPITTITGDARSLMLPDSSFDLVFCHQLLHHTNQQQDVLAEFYRLLKPGGILLVGESCQSFIESLPVKLLFRHPPHAQKNAQGYIDLVTSAGFIVDPGDIYRSRPWWSRSDLGIGQKLGFAATTQEPTEILLLAFKPDAGFIVS